MLQRAGFTEDRALEVLRVVQVYAQGHALAEVSWKSPPRVRPSPATTSPGCAGSPTWSPRDAPDRLLHTAVQYCARCDMNHQFGIGLDLIIRGLEPEAPA